MKKFLFLSLIALLGTSVKGAEPSRADFVTYIESCEAILEQFQSLPTREAWQRAKGVLILNQFKAGVILGVKDGYGVVMVKKPEGGWSLPVIVNAGEASLGLQLGGSKVESVFIITDDKTTRMLYKLQSMNIGADAKAVAGPRAAEKETFNEEILKSPMLAYTKSTGLYAGATVKAGHISRYDKANFVLYDTTHTLPELLYSDWVKPVDEVRPIMALMRKIAP